MDEDTANLLQRLSEELEWYAGSDEPGCNLDSSDAERLITEAAQKVYEHECSQVNLVDGLLRGHSRNRLK